MDEKPKKKYFKDNEVETLLTEIETRKDVLFDPASSPESRRMGWESVLEAFNCVVSEDRHRTIKEIKQKWSRLVEDMKPTLTRQRVATIVGDAALSGVVGAHVGVSDSQADEASVSRGVDADGRDNASHGREEEEQTDEEEMEEKKDEEEEVKEESEAGTTKKTVPDNEAEDTRSQPPARDCGVSSSVPSVSALQPPAAAADAAAVCPTGYVPTHAVLESQQEIPGAIGGITDRLDQLMISRTVNQ
ncbi:hypothetical protein ABVT39_028224 [Epinephelus coioides]